MTERSRELTPPIADFLFKLEETRSNFAKGIFPVDGWITPASDGEPGHDVRTWDRNLGLVTVRCNTQLKVEACLDRLQTAALSSPAVVRYLSQEYYKGYYETIEARRPRSWTTKEVRLCAFGRKIDDAMLRYQAVVRDRQNQTPRTLRAASLRVDHLVRQANAIFVEIQAASTHSQLEAESAENS